MSGMNTVSDKNGFIVVYPNGTGLFNNYILSWNAGECCNYVEPIGVDDVGFIKLLIENMKKEYNIDSQRIYIAGISNGGMMAYRLACELSDAIAAIGSIAAYMPVKECNPSEFLSVIVFHGMNDAVIPYDGGFSNNWFVKFLKLGFMSAADSVSFWAKHNRCFLPPQKTRKENVYLELYTNCGKSSEVAFYTIQNSGHAWPGGKKGWFFGDEPTKDIFASEIIWDFFKAHSKI
jgi:polyhydroxybutyrate depolymerase